MRPHHPCPSALSLTLGLLGLAITPAAGAADVTPPTALAGWACTGACGSSAAQGDLTLSPFASPAYGFVTTSGSEALGVSPLALGANSRGEETNGSRLVSAPFDAAAGDRIEVQFNYVSTDGKGFDDYAWARLVQADSGELVAWLFTARSSNSSTGNIVPGDVLRRDEFDPRAVIVNYADFQFTSKTVDDPVDWAPLGASNGTCWRDNAAGCGYTGWLLSRHDFAAAGSFRLELGVVNWGDGAYDSGLAFDVRGLTTAVPEPGPAASLLAGLALLGGLARRRGLRLR